MNCPACNAPAKGQPSAMDGQVFECAEHGCFAVSSTALAMGFEKLETWMQASALDRARTHMRPCDKFPVITSYHL